MRASFKKRDVVYLKSNVRDSTLEGYTPGERRRLFKHVGRRGVVTSVEVDGEGTDDSYYDVTFLSGFTALALSGYHLGDSKTGGRST